MIRFLRKTVDLAEFVGKVEKISMEPASQWAPAHIDVGGTNGEGKPFCISFSMGEKLTKEEKDA